ncbi:hypothetical protein [Nitrososphaera sp.]|uniref:tyrosine-type recombinase/integrase n=1 Tax=Nitrososphaera sp. TaxID=1971748 RepID=UPI002ED8EE26
MASGMPVSILKSQQVKRFLGAIHNEYTRITYMSTLRAFVQYSKAKTPTELFGTTSKIERRIEDWVAHMKENGLQGTTIRMRILVLKLFYEMNRTPLAWKIITKTAPPSKPLRDVGWTREQLQKMLKVARIREQAMIPLLASSGIRKGVIPLLRIRNLKPRDEHNIYQITCYEGESEEYVTYCSPEARTKLEEYFEYRRRYGEDLTPDSFVFRLEWNEDDPIAAKQPFQLTEKTVTSAIQQIVLKSGLRKTVKSNSPSEASGVRHEQKLLHGIRKFFLTTLRNAGYDKDWAHMLQGHKQKGLDENYYRPSDDTLLLGTISSDGKIRKPGFVDLMRELVVNDEERAKIQVVELEQKITDTEGLKRRVKRLESLVGKKTVELVDKTADVDSLEGEFSTPEPTREDED